MSRHEQYHLAFAKRRDSRNNFEYLVYTTGNSPDEYKIGRKIQVLHKIEVQELISQIQTVQAGGVFDPYFSIDRSSATDDDHVILFTTHISIDEVSVPLQDMKEILQEWLAFLNS